jgi:hypothetical protein
MVSPQWKHVCKADLVDMGIDSNDHRTMIADRYRSGGVTELLPSTCGTGVSATSRSGRVKASHSVNNPAITAAVGSATTNHICFSLYQCAFVVCEDMTAVSGCSSGR